jgi:hypothetical protein
MGGVEGEELGLPGPHGAGQPGQLRHPDAVRPVVEAVQGGAGCWRADRCIDRPEQLLALPGRGHLTTRISSRQPSPQPHSSSAGELLGRGQQQLANAIQRVAFAAPMPEGGLLGRSGLRAGSSDSARFNRALDAYRQVVDQWRPAGPLSRAGHGWSVANTMTLER